MGGTARLFFGSAERSRLRHLQDTGGASGLLMSQRSHGVDPPSPRLRRASVPLFIPQSHHRIHFHGAACRDVASGEGNERKQNGNGDEGEGISLANAV